MTGLNAITFITTDMDAAIRFWQVPGYAIVYGGPRSPFTSLDAGGNSFVNLSTEAAPDRGANWGRVILHVDDPDYVHARFLAAGYLPHDAPRNAEWGERYFHITDHDGNEISFATPLPH